MRQLPAARQILAWRSTDGSNNVVPYTPGTSPGDWQPTPPANLPALAPQWPDVTPFAMTSGSQFRPAAPPVLGSAEYAAAFNEVKSLGRSDRGIRTEEQTQIARFWNERPGATFVEVHCPVTPLSNSSRAKVVSSTVTSTGSESGSRLR